MAVEALAGATYAHAHPGGAPKRAECPRDTYKLWEEPKGPDFVLEMLSSSTWEADLGPKRALYASLGVTEHWLFDPTGEHLAPPLRGMRLTSRGYRDLPVLESSGSAPVLRSEVLGLDARLDRGALRFRDPVTGEDLLSHEEMVAERQRADAAREAAETRVAKLEALLREARS